MTAKTTGAGPLLYKASTIKIVGKEYTMRRLGIFHVTELARILTSTGSVLLTELGSTIKDFKEIRSLKNFDIGAWFEAIVTSLPQVAEDIVGFLVSTLKGWKGDMKDGDQFPLGTELEIIEKLLESEDVVAFFVRGLKLSKSPSIKKIAAMFSGGKSTSSKKPTGGQTKKS